ncbi:hypothetical protein [Paenibacillus sp. Pae108]|uniref:hypothetical protein n=1 Tax=Paenibacillus sp. Pae108 TaxID=2926019 RepID=UPI0021181DAF|nr:hypothetical protein [Paenibacillus sp. Pae108]
MRYAFLGPIQIVEAPVDVHEKMKEDARQIFAKVEISYSDPFVDTSLAATASETGRYTYVNQIKNELSAPDYKFFSLHNNKLDGTFHPLPSEDDEVEVGWWGATLSDASGVMVNHPVISITFDPRPVYSLRVFGDSKLNEFPVDFTIKLYDLNNVLVYTESVTGNTLIYWEKNITPIGSIKKMEVTIQKINKPNSVPKILECYTGVKEEYDGERIIELNLLEEQVFDDQTLPIGNVSTNEIDIRFDNTDKHFDPRNTSSPLYGMLKKNRRVKAWLGVDLEGLGEITYYPLGVFYTTDWNAPTNEVYAETTARDRLELLKQRDFTTSQVYVNQNLYQLADMLLQDFGLTNREYRIDAALQSVVVPYIWFDRVTYREALAQIAEAGLARLYCDRNGIIRLEVQRDTGPSVFEFKEDETIFWADYPFASGQTTNYVETETKPRALSAAGTIFQSTESISIPANETKEMTYKFNFVPCMNVSAPTISAGANITVQSYTVYAWGMSVTFRNSGAVAQNVNSVSINGQKLEVVGGSVAIAQDDLSIRENGKLSKTISNDFIQTLDRAQQISDTILAAFKDPRHDIELDNRGHVALQLGDKITAPGFDLGTTTDYYIVRQETKWDGALSARTKGFKA